MTLTDRKFKRPFGAATSRACPPAPPATPPLAAIAAPPARCDSPAGAHGRKAESGLVRHVQAAQDGGGERLRGVWSKNSCALVLADFWSTHVRRVALVMEEDKALGPLDIRLFRADAQVQVFEA